MHDEIPTGSKDRPDSTDYTAENILGAEVSILPDKVRLWTQADNQQGTVHCTTYSAYHVARILNEVEHQAELNGLPEVGWKLQTQFNTFSEQGDYVQTALKSIVKNGLHCSDKVYPVKGYAVVPKDQINYWLSRGYPIITSASVTATNFKDAKYKGVWGGLDGTVKTGHAFAIIGYENGYKLALNSYGDSWGFYKDGTFKIKDSDVASLNTCYLVYDEADAELIFRDVTTASPHAEAIKYVLDKGIMKGYESETLPPEKRFFKPEQPVTRAELAEVIYRLYGKS